MKITYLVSAKSVRSVLSACFRKKDFAMQENLQCVRFRLECISNAKLFFYKRKRKTSWNGRKQGYITFTSMIFGLNRFGFNVRQRAKYLLKNFPLSTAHHIFKQLSFLFSSTKLHCSCSLSGILIFPRICKNRQMKNSPESFRPPNLSPKDAG